MNKNNKNKISNLDNLAIEIYNDPEFAASYSNKIEYNSHNALYERPAMLELAGDVSGKKILDAGCGPGLYTSILTDKGAQVTAVDYSDEMIDLTRERNGSSARIFKCNLNHELTGLMNEEFDMIISSMVIHYINNVRNLFSEFNRVLRKDGILIFSTHHPFAEFNQMKDGNYFETELLREPWPSYNIVMPSYRRPLSDIFNLLKENDFNIDELIEPVPVEECKSKFPDAYELLSSKPWFICFKATKIK